MSIYYFTHPWFENNQTKSKIRKSRTQKLFTYWIDGSTCRNRNEDSGKKILYRISEYNDKGMDSDVNMWLLIEVCWHLWAEEKDLKSKIQLSRNGNGYELFSAINYQ